MRSLLAIRFAGRSDGCEPRGRGRRANRWAGALALAALLAALLPPSVSAATFSVNGTVTDAAGVGVIGIAVSVCPLIPAPGQTFIACVGSGGTTAADGTYMVSNVPPDSYQVFFRDPSGKYPFGYYSTGGFTLSSTTNVVVTAADVTGINIQYPAVYHITGTITGPDGSPVAGVQVSAFKTVGDSNNTMATSATDGTYSIAVIAGMYTVEAFDNFNNFVPTVYSTAGTGGAATPLDVSANVSGINIKFAPASHISGTLHATIGGQWRFMNIFACSTAVTPGACYNAGSNEDGTFRVAVASGRYLLSFVDFNGGVLPGYWSSHGLVAASARATTIDVSAGDVGTVSASTGPIGVGIHAGTTRTGSFPTKLVSVRRGNPVTVRFAFGKGFAGAKVSIWTAVAGSTGKLGSFRQATTAVVRSDGYVFYIVPAKGLVAFRAQYLPPAGYWASVPVMSASVKAKGS